MWLNDNRWKNALLYIFYGLLIALAVFFVLSFVLNNFPRTGKYTIYSNYCLMISGEAVPIMLDTETGRSWIFSDYAWKPVLKAKDDANLDLDLTSENAKLQNELRDIKIRHELEIKELNAKQDAELKLLQSNKENPCKIGVKSQKLQPKYKFAAKKKNVQSDSNSDEEIDTGEDTRAPVF